VENFFKEMKRAMGNTRREDQVPAGFYRICNEIMLDFMPMFMGQKG